MLIDLATAKLHLRADSDLTEEDGLISVWIAAAEKAAAKFLNRHIYADANALAAAVLAAPASLSAATAAYESAMLAAAAMTNAVESASATTAATKAYERAHFDVQMTYDGIVMDDLIKAAILLILGHLYINREDVVVGVSVEKLPMGSSALLQPYRVGMGI